MRVWSLLSLAALAGCQAAEDRAPKSDVIPIYYDVEAVQREVTTNSAEAQRWFNRGLALAYGFNHEEAIVCFDKAEPAAELLATRAVWHYARGIAYASLGRVPEAEKEQQAFLKAQAAVPATRLLFNNSVTSILKVAEKFLVGEIEYRKKNYEVAFELLREAVALDEKLNYDEPWGWMDPTHHALGTLLTEQKRYEEAIAAYRANLKRYPENGWALHGLSECLKGLGRIEEAAAVDRRFQKAWARSDTVIPGSCFCKTS